MKPNLNSGRIRVEYNFQMQHKLISPVNQKGRPMGQVRFKLALLEFSPISGQVEEIFLFGLGWPVYNSGQVRIDPKPDSNLPRFTLPLGEK